MTQVLVNPGAASAVRYGGMSLVAVYPGGHGGFITNPASSFDQKLPRPEPLYVSIGAPAALLAGAGTVELLPGDTFIVPDGTTEPTWVNAASSGHAFSVVSLSPPLSFPPAPVASTFPPAGPVTMTRVIPSYLYKEYDDDDDLQTFVYSYNGVAQDFIDTLNGINLPIYTAPNIGGSLLDWVAAGLYGMLRPALNTGLVNFIGPYDTTTYNQLPYDGTLNLSNVTSTLVNDDIFKRVLTWHFYKGDGKVFNVRWLKRRVMRFINGVNGTAPNVDETYRVSVSFGLNYQVNITFIDDTSSILTGPYDSTTYDDLTYNGVSVQRESYAPLDTAALIEGIQSGVLELPFQFVYIVTVN